MGKVETSYEVSPEVRQADVWFVPAPQPSTEPQILGLLGKMASSACLFEVFRNAPSPVEVRNCQMKLYALHGKLLREARRASNSLSEAELPLLWILSPSCSPRLVEGFEVRLDRSGNWSRGVFFAPEFQKTALVAINQLPVSEETLWLRVLGRNTTQQQAVNELVSLPEGHPFRRNILEILANWRINVAVGENLTSEDRELIMNLSPAYLQWREEAVEEGIQQGIQQGMLGAQRMMIENIFRVRFGVLDEELAGAIAPLLQLPSEELTRLLLTLSREEFLERFASNSDD